MRFLKLNLMAFGPFTDCSIDLSDGQQRLYLIYGANEAGKSSSLRAITDFLYGIHARTSDDFVHPYNRLRIGAQLQHSDGTVLDLVRRKANQSSLRLADYGAPLEDHELRRFLGEVDRDLFQKMFGIDHERLRRGGAELVQGGGRIGELLFAAGAGITDLQKVQTQLQSDLDKLLTSSGRSGSIAAAITEYKETQRAAKDLQVSVETWRSHDDALRAALATKTRIDEIIRTQRIEQNRLTRVRDAVAAIGRWKKATADLAEVRDAPLLPEDFSETSHAILIELKKSEQRQDDAECALAQLNDDLKALELSEDLLAESGAIELIRDRSGGYLKAMRDRPQLATARELSESEAQEILRKLGRPTDLSAIEALRLPADKTIRIQNLGNQQEGLIERLQAARRDCERIRRLMIVANGTLNDIREVAEPGNLRTALLQVQQEGDLESQLAAVQRDLHLLEENATIQLRRLPLWSGSLTALEALALPSLTTVERFGDEWNDTKHRLTALRERLQEDADDLEQLESALMLLELDQKIPTTDDLEGKRRLREQGWQLVLKAWQEGQENAAEIDAFVRAFTPLTTLPEAYHRSVEESDQLADLLRRDADRVATKAKLRADKERRLARAAEIQFTIEQTQVELQQLEERWQATWEPLGIVPLTPQEMRDWIRQQQAISNQVQRIRENRLEADRLRQQIASCFQTLALALGEVNPTWEHTDSTLRGTLLTAAKACEELEDALRLKRQTQESLAAYQAELLHAESQLADGELTFAKWQSEWAALMQRLGLEGEAIPSQANSVLSDLSMLFKKHQEADQFRTRLEGIDREAREFEGDVQLLVARVANDLIGKPAEEAIGVLTSRLQAARDSAAHQKSLLRQRLEQHKKFQTAKTQISEIKASLDEMCRQAGCVDNEQLPDAARRSSRRRELERSVQSYEEQIVSYGAGADLSTFLAAAEQEAADVDALQPRIDELGEAIEELGKARDECLREIEREELELKKIDGSGLAAEKIAACESLASRLEDQVKRLAVLRVSSAVLQAAIEQHRKANQGPVLGRASDLFRELTRGAFQGLRADFNERGEPVLAGVRQGHGEFVPVAGMSDGTCDQLYLALRIASLEAWLDHHEPIPLIVDDVFLNFDDDRAGAGLRALAELSRRTQVIFFTHHIHLVELAQRQLTSDEVHCCTLAEQQMERWPART